MYDVIDGLGHASDGMDVIINKSAIFPFSAPDDRPSVGFPGPSMMIVSNF
jgi:hypothetical protein